MLEPSFLAPGIASHVASEHAHGNWRWQRARAFFKALKLASHVGNVAGKAFLALATWLARLPGVGNVVGKAWRWQLDSGVGNLAGSTFWRWQPGWQHILALATWLAPKTWCLAKQPFLALPRNTPMIVVLATCSRLFPMVPKLLGVALNNAYGSWRWQRPRAPLQGFILVAWRCLE